MWVFDKISVTDCCGCSSCAQKCTHQAISMLYDAEGFLFPSKDVNKCVDCSQCIGVCPIINSDDLRNKHKAVVYAAQNKDVEDLIKSSSGGIFSIIANYVLEQDGVVVGAAYEKDLFLTHVVVENSKDLYRLRGSKYFASENHHIFITVQKELKKGKLVCFSGTGCQVAALRAFLHKQYENLITVDIVCHGTPSRKAFEFFLKEFEKKRHVRVFDWKFRDKTIEGWQCSSSASSWDSKGNVVNHFFDKIFKSYFNAFISGDMYREGCYNCPFACPQRTGDITLADYWGVEKFHKDIDSFNGVSAILVNTDKGRYLFENVKSGMIYRESRIEWVTEINKNLLYPTRRTSRRDTIYDELSENSIAVINSYVSDAQVCLAYVKYLLKKTLRRYNSIYHFIFQLKKRMTI